MSSWLRWLVVAMGVLGVAVSADAQWLTQTQTPAPAPAKPEDKPADKPEEKPKTLWEEITLFAYIENSYVWNLGHTGRHDVNELRFYDFDAGYSFNMAEFSIKKDPTDLRPWGFGAVVTAGLDAQRWAAWNSATTTPTARCSRCGRPAWSRLLSTRTPSPWRWTTCSSEDVM
jgi:hypothetical protein